MTRRLLTGAVALALTATLVGCSASLSETTPAADAPAMSGAPAATVPATPESPADMAGELVFDLTAVKSPTGADQGGVFTDDQVRAAVAAADAALRTAMSTSTTTIHETPPRTPDEYEPMRAHMTPAAFERLVFAIDGGDRSTVSSLVPSNMDGGNLYDGTLRNDVTGEVFIDAGIEHLPLQPRGVPTTEVWHYDDGTLLLAVAFRVERPYAGTKDGQAVSVAIEQTTSLMMLPAEDGTWLVDTWRTAGEQLVQPAP